MRIRVKVIALAGRDDLVLRWRDPVTGALKQRTANTSNRRTAQRSAARLEADLAAGKVGADGEISWDDFRALYWEEHLPALAKKTRGIVATAFNHVENLLRPRRLSDITAATLSTLQSRMRVTGVKETTIAGYVGHFRAALNWAEDLELIATAPKLKKPKRSKGISSFARGRALSTEEFERMLTATPSVRPKDAALWQRYLKGLWLSGLRLGESLALSWDDYSGFSVDLTGRHPRFRVFAEDEKAHRDRLLPMTPDFVQLLLETPAAERTGPVFRLQGLMTKKPITDKRVSRAISAIGERAKVVVNKAEGKFASAHDLRRSFGTRWAGQVMPAILQKLMRHDSIETTMKYYVGIEADRVADGLWSDWLRRTEGDKMGDIFMGGETGAVSAPVDNEFPSNNL